MKTVGLDPRIKLPMDDTHFIDFAVHGVYQDDTLKMALQYVREPECAIDVGAHVGFWSVPMSKAFKIVHAFEPVEENFVYLQRNTDANVVPHLMALGDTPGLVGLRHVAPENSGAWETVPGGGDALMQTLDSFQFKQVGLIKIDVQGDEERVLKGAVNTIAYWRPVVIVECALNGNYDGRPAAFMSSLGYRMAARINKDEIWVPK